MKSTTGKPVTSSSKKEASASAEDIPSEVLERLLTLLQANNVRQVDFAKAMKKSKDWASRTMNGERGLSVATLVKLSEVYNANLHWLLTGQGEVHAKPDSIPDPERYIEDIVVRLQTLKGLVRENRP